MQSNCAPAKEEAPPTEESPSSRSSTESISIPETILGSDESRKLLLETPLGSPEVEGSPWSRLSSMLGVLTRGRGDPTPSAEDPAGAESPTPLPDRCAMHLRAPGGSAAARLLAFPLSFPRALLFPTPMQTSVLSPLQGHALTRHRYRSVSNCRGRWVAEYGTVQILVSETRRDGPHWFSLAVLSALCTLPESRMCAARGWDPLKIDFGLVAVAVAPGEKRKGNNSRNRGNWPDVPHSLPWRVTALHSVASQSVSLQMQALSSSFAGVRLSAAPARNAQASSSRRVGVVCSASAPEQLNRLPAASVKKVTFAGAEAGTATLALKTAPEDTAKGLVHRYLVMVRQNARRVRESRTICVNIM